MRKLTFFGVFPVVLALGTVLWFSGCGKPASSTVGGPAATDVDDHSEATAHSGWWCGEHGIPEAECSMCNSKVAADFKKKGDWCQEHERAESQCFICNPEAKEKYAAKYRAKYGKEPSATDG